MGDLSSLTYSNTDAYTLALQPNVSYLSNTHSTALGMPQSSSTLGLMMMLSTLQYQAPYINSAYTNVAGKVGQAAYIQSGGKSFQENLTDKATQNATEAAHNVGITDKEAAIILGSAKIIKDREIDVNGPRIYSIRSHLTMTQSSGSIGIKYEW